MYRDRWIECTDDEVRVRGYYFPWGTKRIPYRSIRAVQRVTLTKLRGQLRLWGTSNPRYWASLDPRRGSKKEALLLDVGRYVHPFITPDDCDAVESTIRAHAGLGPPGGETTSAPFV